MKRLSSKEIKRILYGVVSTDGSISRGRFSFSVIHKSYVNYISEVLKNITGIKSSTCEYTDKRFGSKIYKVWSNTHPYFKEMGSIFYDERKRLTPYICDRLDEVSFSHMWMCDGYLEHNKNRTKNKIQNIGYICLEKYPKEELQILQETFLNFGIETVLDKVAWGFGYRIKFGGLNLQKFISLVYPYILDDYKYKTNLYYKGFKYVDMTLPSAEQFVKLYDNIEDIVRYS